MRRLKSYRPSPTAAMLVGIVALLLPIDAISLAQSAARPISGLLRGQDIKDGTVRYKDLSRGAKRRLRGRRGPVGPVGPAGQLAGTPAGGALTGTYPDPAIRPGTPGQFLQSTAAGTAWVNAPFQPRSRRVFAVRAGGDASANGTALRRVLDGVGAGAVNPAVLLLEPGIYHIGADSLAMKPFVDLVGAGEGVTRITGRSAGPGAGTVTGADHAELRFLTVQSTGGGDEAIAIANLGASPRITHVTALASGSASSTGIQSTDGAAPVIRDSSVNVNAPAGGRGVGISNSGAPARLSRVGVTVGGGEIVVGVANASAVPVRIRDSVITSEGTGSEPSTGLRAAGGSLVYVDGSRVAADVAVDGRSNSQLRIGATLLDGEVVLSPSAANSRCVFTYTAAYTPRQGDCTG